MHAAVTLRASVFLGVKSCVFHTYSMPKSIIFKRRLYAKVAIAISIPGDTACLLFHLGDVRGGSGGGVVHRSLSQAPILSLCLRLKGRGAAWREKLRPHAGSTTGCATTTFVSRLKVLFHGRIKWQIVAVALRKNNYNFFSKMFTILSINLPGVL